MNSPTQTKHRVAALCKLLWAGACVAGCVFSTAGCNGQDNNVLQDGSLASVPNFPETGDTLEFRFPAGWLVAQEDGIITIASFSPPHRGIAGSLPNALVITILPYRSTLLDDTSATLTTLSSGTWSRGGKPGFLDDVVFYVGDDLPLTVIGSYPDVVQLNATDLKAVKSLCGSIVLRTGGQP